MKCEHCHRETADSNMRQCKRSSKFSGWCKECWISRKRLVSRQNKNVSRKKDEAAYKKVYRAWCLKRLYGISLEQFHEMFSAQNMKCAICGSLSSGKNEWCVDHDHHANRVRGILCHKCNLMIGLSREEPEILLRAAAYVSERSHKIPTMETGLSGIMSKVSRLAERIAPNYSPPDLGAVTGILR